MFTQAQRQNWMAVLASSPPERLTERWQALDISAPYQRIRAPEIGLAQLHARMGATS